MDSLFDSIEKYEKCCNCGNEIKIDNSKYYMCNKCNRLLTQAKTMIGANRFSSELTYKDQQFTKWLAENNYIDEENLVLQKCPEYVFKDEYNKFTSQATYDVLIFSKGGGKPYLCNEAISYEDAKQICSRDDTKFKSSFAGFSIHNGYPNTRKGKPFEID